jgi:hypothetical protein
MKNVEKKQTEKYRHVPIISSLFANLVYFRYLNKTKNLPRFRPS